MTSVCGVWVAAPDQARLCRVPGRVSHHHFLSSSVHGPLTMPVSTRFTDYGSFSHAAPHGPVGMVESTL